MGDLTAEEEVLWAQEGRPEQREEIMLNDNFSGVVEGVEGGAVLRGNSTRNVAPSSRIREDCGVVDEEHCDHDKKDMSNGNAITRNNNTKSKSPYLILSPSSPVRILAISFLTSWMYYAVMIVTICAFLISSVLSYHTYFNGGSYDYREDKKDNSTFDKESDKGNDDDDEEALRMRFYIAQVTRWILFIVLLLEGIIKSLARGFLLSGKFAYLRICWDWVDVLSLLLIFVSIIIPWKAVEFVAAAIVLLKLIPIHSGSINAFIFLCSCAKKLIPVLVYGLIIVWLFGLVIFTLFVKYARQEEQEVLFVHDRDGRDTGKSTTVSTSDILNENIGTMISVDAVTFPSITKEGDLVESKSSGGHDIFQNLSSPLTMECLPTNIRSLGGSFVQAIQMLTLKEPESKSGDIGSSKDSSSCQYELYILSLIETLIFISGTCPMIAMTFSTLFQSFQRITNMRITPFSVNRPNHCNPHPPLNRSESGESGGSHQRQYLEETSSSPSSSSCFTSSFSKEVANILCDCDYYFCCLANLQRKLYPCASGLLNSRKFKIFLVFVLSTDFLSMISLLWFIGNSSIDFHARVILNSVLPNYIKICFVVYTLEATLKWFAFTSDEYWTNVWSAFDLLVAVSHWIGYTLIHFGSSHSNSSPIYVRFCGILMIRMLKLVPYWKCLEESLKLTWLGVLGNRHYLFVIFICSSTSFILKHAAFMLQTKWTLEDILLTDLIHSLPLDASTLIESLFQLVLYGLFAIVITAVYFRVMEVLNKFSAQTDSSTSNPSISLLLNSSNHRDSQFSEMTIMSCSTHRGHHHHHHQCSESRRSFGASSPPISVLHGVSMSNPSIHHNPNNKYRFASSPSESHYGLLLTPDRRSMTSPRESDAVLSPFLTVPIHNGINNGHAFSADLGEGHNSPLDEESVQMGIANNSQESNSTNFTRNVVQLSSSFCPTVEEAFNLMSSLVIIVSAFNIAMAANEGGGGDLMTWHSFSVGRSLWIEVLFMMSITIHIICRTRLPKFSRATFLQISVLLDLIVILAAAAEVYGSGMRWVPIKSGRGSGNAFLQCAKVLSASRGLLLISRISWLQCVGSGVCYLFWKTWNFLAAFAFLWTIFLISSIEMQKIVMGQSETPPKPEKSSLLNSTILIINATKDANQTAAAVFTPKSGATFVGKENFMFHCILWTISIFFLMLSSGVLLGLLHNRLQSFGKLIEKFATSTQVAYQRSRIWQNQHFQFPFPVSDSKPKPTEGICVPILYFITNHPTWDIIIMVTILLDGIGMSLEHLATSERALILRRHYPAYMVFLYSIELTLKLIGNGSNFFKCGWNIFDSVIISISVFDFFICLIHQSWAGITLLNIRFLRILRLFQFLPFVRRTPVIQSLFLALPKLFFVFWNFLTFYFCLYLAVLLLRVRCESFGGGEISPSFPTLLQASPFESPFNLESIYECLANSCLANSTIVYVFVVIISLARIPIVFCVCLALTLLICLHLSELDESYNCSKETIINSRSLSFRNDHDDGEDGEVEHVQRDFELEDKSSNLMPCITPDTNTSHDLETPTSSSAGTSSRGNRILVDPNMNSDQTLTQGLYDTTTFTSTREINGCKVFFVEAMVTTV